MQELYVYYKLEPGQAEAALAAFRQLQAALKLQLPGMQSRLLQRPVTAGAQQTWMEVHSWPQGATPPDGWQALIEAQAEPLPGSQRQVEVFEPLA
ncbi:DUF4936 family protein [Roseateles toxinivorans]|uniref:Uncharacterized protein DUF4936 n=1 Tax=Roseateles toxinivorans TaxID=270368 RepID=A0A4R6QUH7_9BURK|nr:DUF4936 family protein [Roseateles toxinivorans]TDP74679.1 uncharacterized protein DUF4936 [Roseateles toxinivorans]